VAWPPIFAAFSVMPALIAGIHVLKCRLGKDVDRRIKSGHDEPRAN
jgi:hypothetical protein